MKTITILITLLMLNVAAHARLGETVNECVKRYGKPSGMDEKNSTFHFTKEGIEIHVTFDGGKCVKISYQKQEMSGLLRSDFDRNEVLRLLAANGGDQDWRKTSSGLIDDEWSSEKNDLVGMHQGVNRRLVVMTAAWFSREKAKMNRKTEDERTAKAAAEKARLRGF